MSKLREHKQNESKPKDPKGRFVKSTSQIPSDLFGSRKTPPTNPTQRYIRKESDKEQGSTSRLTELQTTIQLPNPSSETTTEGKETMQQYETTVEQPAYTPTSGIEIEQIVHPKLISNFLENLSQEVVISQIESKTVEVQSETPFFTRDNPLSEPSCSNNISEQGNQLLNLLDNMAEEEERIMDEE